MSVKSIVTLLLLAGAGTAALADDITIVVDQSLSLRDRAEVCAEAQAARRSAMLVDGEAQFRVPMAADTRSTVTREQVRAERHLSRQPVDVTINPAA